MSGIIGSRLNTRGSGLVGSLGTDGQVLTSSGAGAGAVMEDAGGGDFVKIATATVSGSAAATINLEGCFTSTYTFYQCRFERLVGTAAAYFFPSMLNASNTVMTDTAYMKGRYQSGEFNQEAPEGQNGLNSTSGLRLTNDLQSNRSQLCTSGTMDFFDPQLTITPSGGGSDPQHTIRAHIFGGALSSNYYWQIDAIVYQSTTTAYGGIQFKMSSGSIETGFTATMYGIKT